MNKITINGNDYTLGLMWTRLGGESNRKEIADLIKNLEAPYGLLRKSFDKVHVGLIDEEISNGTLSAAALLAEVAGDCVIVDKIDDDRYWICCVIGGEVIPGSDIIVNSDGVLSFTDEFASVPSYNGEALKIYASEEVCEETGVEADENLSFEDLVEEFGDAKSKHNLIKIKKLNSNAKAFIIAGGVIVLGLAGMGGYWFMGELEKQRQIEEYEAELARNAARENSREVVSDEVLIQRAYDEEVGRIDKEFKKKAFNHVMPSYLSVFKRVGNSDLGGWELMSLDIAYNQATQSFVTEGQWRNSGHGNYKSLELVVPSDAHAISNDAKAASTKYDLPENPNNYDNHYEKMIKGNQKIKNETIDDLLKLGVTFKFDRKPVTDRFAGIPGLKPTDERLNRRQAPYNIHELAIKGSGLDQLEAVTELLTQEKFAHLVLKKVDTKINGEEILWSLIGELYEN